MRPPRFPVLAGITAPDGARLTVRALAHEDPTTPVVVLLPAMGMAARHYTPLVRTLHRRGMTVVTTDLRGHGESRPLPGRGVGFGYREIVEHDVGAVLRRVREAFPHAPVLLLGHSLGGQLGLVHCGLYQPDVAGVVLVATGSAWYRCFGPLAGPRWLLLSQLYAAGAALLGYWPGERLGFAGRESARLIRDWARQVRTGRYEVPGAHGDYEAALRQVRLPVLAVDVESDDLAPPRAVAHLCGKMPAARVDRWHYARSAAGGRPLDHFRWIRHHRGLVERITTWASEVVPETAGRAARSPAN
ncbi:alpha/beta hydrolase [Streptomyces cinnamoneus]|uniref:Alpha/beta hydrolase n=1 Tax=Streptomyces cinnamoneus TaxID=53446 RepID=A0A2G1XJQ5_STRCJ|nr:alpha/beta fold hydrolase [Streptomyces cinnamoneus]PHQ51440.1 alpha/beta hydrolase [Streptomyces cinnamoneus]PPT11781.1 alpha/beta hydrolase [Streptomyces cinnamoneus]